MEDRPGSRLRARDCLSDDFIFNILRSLDRTVPISAEAVALLESVAADFLATVKEETIRAANLRRSDSIKRKDVHFSVYSVYGMNLPGSGIVPFPTAPAQQYSDQLTAVETFLSKQKED
jgi:histone H3/H4